MGRPALGSGRLVVRETAVPAELAVPLAAVTVVPIVLFFGGWYPEGDPTVPFIALLGSPLAAGLLAGIAVGRGESGRRWIRWSLGLIAAVAVWFVISLVLWSVVLSGMD